MTDKTASDETTFVPSPQAKAPHNFLIAGIGASAGGLEAYEVLFKAMPADTGIGFVLVVHLDPAHSSLLPEILQRCTTMPVHSIKDSMTVEPNQVYVIPPNKGLKIIQGVLYLAELGPRSGGNLPIDTFFQSLAEDQGARAIGVILSGTGSDGTLGIKAINAELGLVMVQDEKSAKFDGMPHSAIATGLADFVLPPESMPQAMLNYAKSSATGESRIMAIENTAPDSLQKIFFLLRTHTGHDFSCYKKNTLYRRIKRRMQLYKLADLADYVRYLQASDREIDDLYKELLIGVTNFFRDPEAFGIIKSKVLPALLSDKPEGYTVRVWVAGCSTGEEAYSIAILLQECIDDGLRHYNVQIFGTDIDSDAINFARGGLYPANIVTDVSAERLIRFFIKEDDGQYRIKKSIREMLVFAPQNIIKDPPFTKLDIISCRNLLIYFDAEMQGRLLPLFHYSLKPNGLLFLGSSETIRQATDLFSTYDKKWKIYRKNPANTVNPPALDLAPALLGAETREGESAKSVKRAEELSALQLIKAILHESDMPPCVIIDDSYNIIYVHGGTGHFLELAEGKTSMNILAMARPNLKNELAAAIRQVSAHKKEIVVRGIKVAQNGGYVPLDLVVKPMLENGAAHGLMMVLFLDKPKASRGGKDGAVKKPARKTTKSTDELEQELLLTRETLQTTIEELEASNEELKSTIEELQSTNEELQSTNEEMETSKEELQSLNEESITVNAELQNRIDDLSKANDDMKNFLDSTDIATIFLDTDLRIRRFTAKMTDLVHLAPTDIGRPINNFATILVDTDLASYAVQVLRDLDVRESEVKSKDGKIYVMRMRPYRTVANVIEGMVITFEDITQRHKAIEAADSARIFVENILHSLPQSIFVLDQSMRVFMANSTFYRTFRLTPADVEKRIVFDLGSGNWDIPELKQLLRELAAGKKDFGQFAVCQEFPSLGRKTMLISARRITQPAGDLILVTTMDVPPGGNELILTKKMNQPDEAKGD